MDTPLLPSAPALPPPPAPQMLLQIVKSGDQVSVHKPDEMPWFGVIDLLIGLLPELWRQAKADASNGSRLVAPPSGFVAQLKNRLHRNNGKV